MKPKIKTDNAAPRQGKDRSQLLIAIISMALFVWGSIHAVGAYRYNYDLRKPLIVYACVGFFIGFWWLMLAVRRRAQRTKFERTPELEKEDLE